MQMLFRIALLVLLCLPVAGVRASETGEGMWIPLLLGVNEADMQAQGLQLSAEDIYSVNHSSLKDAIVRFGGGCTGEIISADGLLLTNHHCGFGQIRRHSTVEQNYLKNGFWAMSREEELPNPGLTATFVVRIEDVTEAVLDGLPADADEKTREAHVARSSRQIELDAIEDTHYEAEVRPFYYGNEYYLIITEVFEDVRLVGAPPQAIGKFGGETDNWLWPRHNADFSLFRVYAGPDGKPAPYAEENVPLEPRHFLPIAMDGLEEGDFTMVFGFPGTTQEYLPAEGVRMIQEVEDPIRVKLRGKKLEIMNRYMRADEAIRLMYASKESGIANGYTKWKGRILGLEATDGVARKEAQDAAFQARVEADAELKARYGDLLDEMNTTYAMIRESLIAVTYFIEGGYTLE
ncbi:MAG: serine protease, partial [Bacteroidetes bacterium]